MKNITNNLNMKKLTIVLLAALVPFLLKGQAEISKIKWYTFEQALELSKKAPKKLMIDVYTDWCGWCKKMDADTWSNTEIAKYVNEHFYAVKFNAEQKADIIFQGKTYKYVDQGNGKGYHELAAALLSNQLSFPTVSYLNEKLELLGPVPGYRNAHDLEPLLVYISEDKFKTVAFDAFQKSFEGKIK
jgi:thioredoxin-related protein